MSEATDMIKARIAQIEKDREVAIMAKARAERDAESQQKLVDIYDGSLSSLRGDLSTLEQSGSQVGQPDPEPSS